MKIIYQLLFICITCFFSSCGTPPIELLEYKSYPAQKIEDPFVVYLIPRRKINSDTTFSKDVQKVKIATIKLNTTKLPISKRGKFDSKYIERKTKKLGANYIVHWNYLGQSDIDCYFVENIRDYEIGFKWNKNRTLDKTDFKGKIIDEPVSIYSNFQNPLSRGFQNKVMLADRIDKAAKYGSSFDINLSNSFHCLNSICSNCSEMELMKENMKFNFIELYLRKATKESKNKIFKNYNELENFILPFQDSLRIKEFFINSLQIKKNCNL